MMRIRHKKVIKVRMQRDPLPRRREVANLQSERKIFRQSRESCPEQPGVTDGYEGCC